MKRNHIIGSIWLITAIVNLYTYSINLDSLYLCIAILNIACAIMFFTRKPY